jgi:hypothetical protein
VTTLPFIPATPEDFVRLMTGYIWADESKPADDGGIIASTSIWYDDWRDARKVARRIGMKCTAQPHGRNGDTTYRFPETMLGVTITLNDGMGSAVRIANSYGTKGRVR